MSEKTPSLEESFRSDLESVVAISSALGQHCESVADLVDLCKLGVESDAQLKLLMSLVTAGKQKR